MNHSHSRHCAEILSGIPVTTWYPGVALPEGLGRHRRPGLLTRLARTTAALVQAVI